MGYFEDSIEEYIDLTPPEVRETKKFKDEIERMRDSIPKYVIPESVQATPLFEMSAVTIHLNNNRSPVCQVYGFIRLTDQDDYYIDIFKRKRSEAETVVANGGKLTLTHPCGDLSLPLLPSEYFKVSIFLRDKLRDIEIAKDYIHLNVGHKVDYDQLQTKMIKGDFGYAKMHYTNFHSAVVAFVDIKAVKKDATVGTHNNVYGTIIASTKGIGGFTSRFLFEKQLDESFRVDYDSSGCGWVSKTIMAVPASGPLNIVFNLWDADTSRQCALGLTASHSSTNECKLVGQELDLEVVVNWRHIYHFLAIETESSEISSGEHNTKVATIFDTEVSENVEQDQKRLRIHTGQQQLVQASTGSVPIALLKRREFLEPLVEVSAIFIHRGNEDDYLPICGTIGMYDEYETVVIFEKERNNPEFLIPGSRNRLMLASSRCFSGRYFGMELDLTDVEGQVICRGRLAWGLANITSVINWYNKRICSVILGGEQCHATVHYTIFPDAVQAKISVALFLRDSFSATTPIDVHGKIYTRYGSYTYSNDYDKEGYESILFLKDEAETVELTHGQEVPMSKAFVSVPTDDFLLLQTELYAKVRGSDKLVELDFSHGFVCQEEGSSSIVHGNGIFSLSFHVDWIELMSSMCRGADKPAL